MDTLPFKPKLARPDERTRRSNIVNSLRGYAFAVATIAMCTIVSDFFLPYFDVLNLVMVYLLGVILVASRTGLGPSIAASVLAVLTFDFFLVPPRFTFAVSDLQYLATFVVMLTIAVTVSSLTVRNRAQADAALLRERRTDALYAMSREFAATSSKERLAEIAAQHIGEIFESQITVWMRATDGRLIALLPNAHSATVDTNAPIAEWVYANKRAAGLETDMFPNAAALFLPLTASRKTIGVLAVQPAQAKYFLSRDRMDLLETFANQTALALERARLVEEAQQSRMQIETERLRNSLLSSVSHDLRTPLAAITGASSSLLEGADSIDVDSRRDLAQTIYDEAERLNRLIRNLLDMTRIESGAIQVKKEWNSLEEVIGATLARLDQRLKGREVTTHLPADLLVPHDSILLEQVFVNLLENAIKYTPADSPIEIAATLENDRVLVKVLDRGPGILPGTEEHIFDKFYRAHSSGDSGGVGLGLTVCRGIIEAHGGRIWAQNRPDGGAEFCFTLPLAGKLPEV
jgi:two-component system sensor histidine kinase KdpD